MKRTPSPIALSRILDLDSRIRSRDVTRLVTPDERWECVCVVRVAARVADVAAASASLMVLSPGR